ncbi:MAG: Mut7-C ubiquitin/RNAse domain-containing protein [Bacteroidetes bacterium]|nr:Mut7-C ubiquitin/RNAse domain-containing protein [Bacteroidota bacterium]
MKTAHLRFYEELNDFLPDIKKKIRFEHKFSGKPSVKDMIESLGIPHGEVDLILVNSNSVDFSYLVNDGDDISVYPVFESLDIKNLQHLREKPLRNPKFILDVHLGTLAKYMRMLGFDTLYKNNYSDEELIEISFVEKRTILTKDIGILKNKKVTHGYFVRDSNPEKQIEEVIVRFNLKGEVKTFSRCLECNSILKLIKKEKIIDRLPLKVRTNQNEFYTCSLCDKIYWPGSHYKNMNILIEKILLGS